jgi:hypothetical protein
MMLRNVVVLPGPIAAQKHSDAVGGHFNSNTFQYVKLADKGMDVFDDK